MVIFSVPVLPSQGLPLSFISSIEVSLDLILDCDLVVGMVWFGLCCVVMLDGIVEFNESRVGQL